MSSEVIASRRRRVQRSRRFVRVGVHAAVGRIDRPSRTTSSAASLVASSSCWRLLGEVGREEGSPDGVQGHAVHECGDVHRLLGS
jgi:hypothetical protein